MLIGEQSSDPKVKLVVKGRYTLRGSTYPDKCLGWYSATWTGSSKNISLWNENNSALLKKELITALREQSHDAISYLFNSDEDHVTRHQTYDSYPAWIDCYEARYQNIKNYAD
jgi:hypothetical protein